MKRPKFANVAAAIALFISLGASAYAAHDYYDSISPRDLNFALGGDGVTKTDTVPSTGSLQTIATTKVKVDDKIGAMQISAAVEVDNSVNGVPAEVKIQALLNGKAEEGLFTTTIPASATGTGFALIQDNGLAPGTYTVTLQAQASSVTFNDRTLSVETSPRD